MKNQPIKNNDLKEKKVLLTKNDIYEMITSDKDLEEEVKQKGKNIPAILKKSRRTGINTLQKG